MTATRDHKCPRWCHRCPDLVAIVAERGGDVNDPQEVTMPMCMGGATNSACHCHAFENRSDHRFISTRSERLALLRELVVAYPMQARQLVADLAPPKEQAPQLVSVPSAGIDPAIRVVPVPSVTGGAADNGDNQ